jgi:hypothetical protein
MTQQGTSIVIEIQALLVLNQIDYCCQLYY